MPRCLLALCALAAPVASAAPARAQSPLLERHLPDFELHRTTGSPYGWHGCRGDGERTECGLFSSPEPPRYRFEAGGFVRGRRRGGAARALLGLRSRRDRFLQLRTEVSGGPRSGFGAHRLRGRWDAGEIDARVRHGDTAEKIGFDSEGQIADADVTAKLWWEARPPLREEMDHDAQEAWWERRRSWWRKNAARVPLAARYRALGFRGPDRAARRMEIVSVSSGVGLDFAEAYQPDGWLETFGVRLGRARIEGPKSMRSLELVELRLASLDEMVAVDDFDMVALWDLGLKATWLRDRARSAAVFGGRLGLVVRYWDHGTFGLAVGQKVRPADTADGMVSDFGVEGRAGFDIFAGVGADLRFMTHRRRRLLEPGARPVWSGALHASWHIEVSGAEVGLQHNVERERGWMHQTGAFVRFGLTSKSGTIFE